MFISCGKGSESCCMYIFYGKEDFRGKIGNQKYVGDSKWLKSILALFIKINNCDFLSPFYIHSIDFRHGTSCESDGEVVY